MNSIKKHKKLIIVCIVILALLAAAFYFGGNEPGARGWNTGGSKPDAGNDGTDQYMTDPIPEGMPEPVEPQNAIRTGETGTCTISITCASILEGEHMDWFDKEKIEILPDDGWILPETEVIFSGGDSVFDVLLKACIDNDIHIDYVDTPLYNSAYIRGIGNIYQFDCGSASGWMYRVNDWFPIYGMSRYAVKDGDMIYIIYTCEMGEDVGGGSSMQTGN